MGFFRLAVPMPTTMLFRLHTEFAVDNFWNYILLRYR